MARPWSEVIARPGFQSLSPEDQENARLEYFTQVVAPRVAPDQIDSIRAQFDADTKKVNQPAERNTDVSTTNSAVSGTPPQLSPQEQFAKLHRQGGTGVDALGKAGLDILAAVPELVAQGVTGIAGGVKGLFKGGSALASGEGLPAATEATRQGMQDLTYQPRSQAAQAVGTGLKQASRALEPVAAPIEAGLNKIDPNLAGAVSAFGEAAVSATPAAAVATAPAKAAIRSARTPAPSGAARLTGRGSEAARAAGYEARPSDFAAANPGQKTPGTTREALSGTHEAQKSFTLKNQARTNEYALEDMGLKKGDKLTPENLDKARQPHNAVYDQTAQKVGTFKTPDDARTVFESMLADTELPRKQRNAIMALRDNMNGQDAINSSRYLRSKARAYQRSNDAKTQDLGDEMMEAADTIETAIESRLNAIGETDQFAAFKEARTSLAKIHDYQVAMRNGQVDAHVLTRLDKKYPNRMTGNAAIIANAGDSLPGVTGLSTKATGTGSVGVPTSKTGVVDSVIRGAGRAALKLTGNNIDSPKMQNKFGRVADETEASYKPAYAPKFAPPREAPGPQLGTETVDFTPTGGVTPVSTVNQGLGMELVDDTPTVGGVPVGRLPDAPPELTAEVPPPVRYPGGLDFTPTSTSLADELAGDLGLAPSPGKGQRFAPIVGRDPSGVPHGDMIDFVTDGMGLAKPDLTSQLGLGALDQPPAPLAPLSLDAPPGVAPAARIDPQLTDQLGLEVDTKQRVSTPDRATIKLENPPGRVGKTKPPETKGKKAAKKRES